MHQSFETPRGQLPQCSYSPVCVSLGGGVNTCFHFFVAWLSDGSKSSEGRSERTTSSCLKIRPTSLWMSRGFTFNLSVVTFSCRLVISTFDINYLRSSCSWFLLLEILFKVWWEDLRKTVTADSTQGTLVCTADYQGAGTFLGIFAPVSRNFTGFHTHTEWMSLPCRGVGVGVGVVGVSGGGVVSNDWCIEFY